MSVRSTLLHLAIPQPLCRSQRLCAPSEDFRSVPRGSLRAEGFQEAGGYSHHPWWSGGGWSYPHEIQMWLWY